MTAITEEHIDTFLSAPTLNMYQIIATTVAFYPGKGSPLGLAYVALKLNGEAGEVAEHISKAMRDDALITDGGRPGIRVDFNELTEERKALLIKEVGDCLWYLSAMCNELGITLETAARINLEKLADRSRRGALQGSGDAR